MKRMKKQVEKSIIRRRMSKLVIYLELVIAILSSALNKITDYTPESTSIPKVETIFRNKEFEDTYIEITVRSSNFDVKYQRKKVTEYKGIPD